MSLTPNTVKYGLKIRSTTGVETSIYSGSNADLSTLATITGQTTLGSLFLRDDGTILKKNTDTDNISDWVELAGGSSSTSQVKVSANDTTEGYAEDKVVRGPGIIRTVVNEGGNEQLKFELGPHYKSIASTGLYTGAVLSVGTTTGTFDISAGEGLFIDSTSDFGNIEVGPVVISARTNIALTNIATQPVTYILIDKDDNIIQNTNYPTPTERRNYIFIGVVVHSDNVNVLTVNNLPSVALDITAQLQDLYNGLGFFNLSGNIISPNGTNLSINKSAGTGFKAGSNFENNSKDPHTVTLASQNAATFRYRNQDSSEDGNVTVIDPTTYDLGGTTSSITGSNFQATIQRIYIFPSNIIRVQRGQEIFSNLAEAIDAVGKESFVTENNIAENGLLLASLAVIKGATDLSDTSQAQFFTASRFGELGSVGSTGTATLQGAYDNSVPNPEILTSDTNGGLTLRRGTTGGDTDTVIEVQNNAGTTNFSVAGDGHIDNEIRQRLINTASPTAITKLDGILLFDTTSTAITIDLPSASIGKVKIPYKDIGANAYVNNITINTDGADTVVTSVTGLSSATININGDSGYFLSNGIDTWYLFGAYQNLT